MFIFYLSKGVYIFTKVRSFSMLLNMNFPLSTGFFFIRVKDGIRNNLFKWLKSFTILNNSMLYVFLNTREFINELRHNVIN
jgi:hypothetical protein